MVKVQGQNSNRKTVKKTAKNGVCDVSGATRSHERFKNVHDQPESIRKRPFLP